VDAARTHRHLYLWPALAALLLFLPSLRGSFVYDDRALLSLNPQMQDWGALWQGFTTPFWQLVDATRDASGFYRPLAVFSFGSLWQLGDGAPWIFHAFALLLHAACAVGLSRLVWQLGGGRQMALWAGLLFAVLGAHVEAVSWISAIPDLLATLGALFAMTAFARGRGWLGALWLLLALLSKESAASVGLVLGLWALWQQRRALLPLAACGLVWYLLRVQAFDSLNAGFDRVTTHHALGGLDQLFLSLSLLGRDLLHLLWPWPHPIFDPLRLDIDWRSPARWAWGLLGLLAAGISLLGMWRHRAAVARVRMPWLGAGFLFLALLPVMNTKALGQYPFEERFLYLPSLGFAVLLAGILGRLPSRSLASLCGLLLLAGNSLSAYRGQQPWHDEESLFTWAREQSPDAMTGHIEYGRLHLELAQQDPDPLTREMEAERALQAYQRSLEVDPDKVLVTAVERQKGNLGLADALYLQLDFKNAEDVYRRTVEHYRESPIGYLGIGNCRAQEGLRMLAEGKQGLADAAFREALDAFDTALEQKPGLQNALTGKANALAQLGRFRDAYGPALAAYEQAPQDLNALMLLLSLDVQGNRMEDAVGLLEAFLQRYPEHPRRQDVLTTLEGLRQMMEQPQ